MCSTIYIITLVCISLTQAFQIPSAVPTFLAGNNNAAQASLEADAKKLNPVIGYFDPLSLAGAGFWGQGNEATIGFLRHSEIKHGRVAMAAFVGYIVQSNIHFPWKLTMGGMDMPSTDLSPPEQWDSLPTGSKLQILGAIGFLEFWSELSPVEGAGGQTHYMRGGQPGKYPNFEGVPHWVPFKSLYDPFNFHKKQTSAQKEAGLLKETNNGSTCLDLRDLN